MTPRVCTDCGQKVCEHIFARLAAAERRAEEAERERDEARANTTFTKAHVMTMKVRDIQARAEAAEARLREVFERLRWIVDLNHERRIHDYLDSLGSHDPNRCRTCLAARALRSPGDHTEDGTEGVRCSEVNTINGHRCHLASGHSGHHWTNSGPWFSGTGA